MCRAVPALLAVVAPLCLPAAAPAAASLAEVLAQVHATSPRLEAGRASLRAADEGVPRALAGRRPQLAATSSATLDAVDTNKSSAVLQTLRQSLNLRQSLYSGGENDAALARAESAVRAEQARLLLLEQAVLLEAIAAYVGMARESTVLALAQANERRLEVQLESARERERFGDLTKTDVAQARSRHARAVADRLAAEGQARISAAEYERVVGAPPDVTGLPEPPEALPEALVEALTEGEGSWRILEAEHELAAADDEVALAVAALKPRLTLEGEVSYVEEPSTFLDRQANASIGAVLAVPLYRGGGDRARVRQSRELLTQRRYALDDVRRGVAAEITAAWERLGTAERRLGSIQVQLDAAAFAVDGVRQEALAGLRTVLELLDAEQELFAAEVELASAEAERVLAGYGLQAAIGRLTAADLGLETRPEAADTNLEPSADEVR